MVETSALPTDEIPDESHEVESAGPERLIYFSDAVIAIAITLLALELPVPDGDVHGNGGVLDFMREHLTEYVAFLISFLVIITVLVFVHELGHFLVARWCGIRVDVFSIGFGPELFGWTDRRGTRWKFSALPLGGYVRMFGDQS